ncbi:MAG: FAD-binding oxidoreductase [Anaerolineales bacterium]|nr:FAD-binding oxidoreductase [Anaerolineales bacterium]
MNLKQKTGATSAAAHTALPRTQLEQVTSWGGASASMAHVFRPTTLEGVRQVFELARQTGRSVGLKGGGNSYGDAFSNSENIVLDLTRMNRILAWEPENGRITAEPGVTLEQLWQYILEDGWWPPVVTGTMKTTLGGCAAMNVHGKNAWQAGPIGDHILSFELLLPSGEVLTCSRDEHADLFHAAIGGFGMLGCFVSLTLQMKRIYSGYLQVETAAPANLAGMFAFFEQNLARSSYIVGWIDAFASGPALGRGDAHLATYLPAGADPQPQQSLRLEAQRIPDTIMGLVPKSAMWMFMRPFMNNYGTQLINTGKYYAGRFGSGKRYLQTHAAFHFLLDYIPGWKKSYGGDGLIQYQPFIPAAQAQAAFAEILRTCQRHGLPNYLTVFKRHRPDDFLMTHSLDGYSMAMDFLVTADRREQLARLARELDEIVLGANGRFYFAKDSTLRPETVVAYLGQKTVDQFLALKNRCDPDCVLQTDLWRRLFIA